MFKATPEGYSAMGENKLGEEVFATPTISGGRIYTRVATKVDGRRVETLYCIGHR